MRLLSVLSPSLTSRYPQAMQLVPRLGSFGRRQGTQSRIFLSSPQEIRQQGRWMMMSSATSSHYESHFKAESYDDASLPNAESSLYMENLVKHLRDRLQMSQQQQETETDEEVDSNNRPRRRRCILDIGGGTGNFAQALVRNDDTSRIVVVDPFLVPATTTSATAQSSGDNIIDDNIVSFVKAPAEDFLLSPSSNNDDNCWRTSVIDRNYDGYDQILVKEAVHHFDEKDRVGIFRGMRKGLRSQRTSVSAATDSMKTTHPPSILIVTRPQTDIDYPLWDEAHDVWEKNQPSIETIENDLKTAGFTNLQRSVVSFPCSISLDRWQSMIRTRFWSTFSNFSDDELERGCEMIAAEATTTKANADCDDDGVILHFEDRLIFLTAS